MQTGIENIKDLAELISYVIASVSLIGIWIAYAHSKKQIHFSAMDKFVKDFRDFQISGSDLEDERALEYIELVNEEFFYMENGYLPIELWLSFFTKSSYTFFKVFRVQSDSLSLLFVI